MVCRLLTQFLDASNDGLFVKDLRAMETMKADTWDILKETGKEFLDDKVLRLSAALAYYALFFIGPLLIIVVGLTSLAFGKESVHHAVQQQLQSFFGES